MNAQRNELLAQLPAHGWDVVTTEDAMLEWWADEIWLLESSWSPVGARAYVTFLVDPMAPVERKKGQHVWAVMASPARPADRMGVAGEFTLSLGRGWKGRLPDFWDHLSKLRS